MQAAIEAFMLGKSKSSAPTSPQKESDDNHQNSNVRKKCYRSILRAFQGRVEEWNDANKQLKGVLGSIANLRDRVYWESRRLKAFSVGMEGKDMGLNKRHVKQKHRQPPWRSSGYRNTLFMHRGSCALLKEEDIQLALNHDLLQHERMLSALRSTMASMAKTVDDIGRRLDEWMIHNLNNESDWMIEDKKTVAARLQETEALELAQEVFSLLASDLYSKQMMAMKVFDSCHDGVLEVVDVHTTSTGLSNDNTLWMSDPRAVIKRASKEFPSSDSSDPTLAAVNQLMNID